MISAGHGQKNDKKHPIIFQNMRFKRRFFLTIPLNLPVVQLDAFHQTLMVLISFHADQIFHGWFCSLLVHSHVDLLLVAHSYVCFCQIFNRGVTELDCSITFTELAVAQNDSAITVITTLWNCNGGDAIFLTFDYKAMVTVMPLFLSFDLRWTLFQHEASWWFPPDCESPVRIKLSFWNSDSKDLAQNWIKNSPFSSFWFRYMQILPSPSLLWVASTQHSSSW